MAQTPFLVYSHQGRAALFSWFAEKEISQLRLWRPNNTLLIELSNLYTTVVSSSKRVFIISQNCLTATETSISTSFDVLKEANNYK